MYFDSQNVQLDVLSTYMKSANYIYIWEFQRFVKNKLRNSIYEEEKIFQTHADISKPHEWYPEARKICREIYYHYGPTNSGKTWAALEALM